MVPALYHLHPGFAILDQPLPLQITQRSLPRQKHRLVEASKGFPEIGKPLFPADVVVHVLQYSEMAKTTPCSFRLS